MYMAYTKLTYIAVFQDGPGAFLSVRFCVLIVRHQLVDVAEGLMLGIKKKRRKERKVRARKLNDKETRDAQEKNGKIYSDNTLLFAGIGIVKRKEKCLPKSLLLFEGGLLQECLLCA